MNGRIRQVIVAGVLLLLALLAVSGCIRSKPPRALGTVPPASTPTAAPEAASALEITTPLTTSIAYSAPVTATVLVTSSPIIMATTVPLTVTLALTLSTATPLPLPTILISTPLPFGGEVSYTVRTGDTLLSISATYQTTPSAIMSRNGLPSDYIEVGQVLVIPVGAQQAGTPQPAPPTNVKHTVKVGETLSQLSRTYHTTPADIRAANPDLTDPNHLVVGSVLTITVGTAPVARYHTVRAGETLSGIARHYGVTVGALAQANGLVNPANIRVGQILVIP